VSDTTPNDPQVARVEELVGRVSVLARRLSRPIGIAGWIGLVAGLAVWVLLSAPVWPDGPAWWSSVLSLSVLCSPGLWLVFHRWWLDRAFVQATELAPAATATALQTYARARTPRSPGGSGSDQASGGRVRRAWRFYRGTIFPLQSHVSDALGVTLPFRPYVLAVSAVALVLTLALLLCVPVALVIRVILQAT
jgi:hypothetical protein